MMQLLSLYAHAVRLGAPLAVRFSILNAIAERRSVR